MRPAHSESDEYCQVRERLFHCRERFAVSAFVAERPEKNTSMVAIRQNHVAHTPAHLLRPSSVRTRHASCKSVSFEVVFAHNHNAVLVAKLVEMAAVGIVRSSYAVDVVFLRRRISFRCTLWAPHDRNRDEIRGGLRLLF